MQLNTGRSKPLVSVVIPTFKGSERLRRAISSVLNQSYKNLEVIVVDDGSEHPSERVVESFDDDRIKYLQHEENKGGAAARNTGIRNSEGRYIAFLDDDDVWLRSKISKQLKTLTTKGKDYFGVHSGFIKIFQRSGGVMRSTPIEKDSEELIEDVLMGETGFGGTSSLVVKRKCLEEINGFDEDFSRLQDWELLVRLIKRGNLAVVEEPLVVRYICSHPSPESEEISRLKFLSKYREEIELRGNEFERKVLNSHLGGIARNYLLRRRLRRGLLYFSKMSGVPLFKNFLSIPKLMIEGEF